MLHAQKLLTAPDLGAIRAGLAALAAEHAARRVAHRARRRGRPDRARAAADRAHRCRPAARVHLGRSRNDQVLHGAAAVPARCGRGAHRRRRHAVAQALEGLAAREASTALPGYTHMQQAMPSSVALWAARLCRGNPRRRAGTRPGAAAHRPEPARLGRRLRHARGCRSTARRPGRSWGLRSVHEPVTAVQLSRGKAESQLLFEIALLMQDLGRLRRRRAAVLHPGIRFRDAAGGVHHRLLDHAAEAQPGSCSSSSAAAPPPPRRACSRRSRCARSCPPAITAICSC